MLQSLWANSMDQIMCKREYWGKYTDKYTLSLLIEYLPANHPMIFNWLRWSTFSSIFTYLLKYLYMIWPYITISLSEKHHSREVSTVCSRQNEISIPDWKSLQHLVLTSDVTCQTLHCPNLKSKFNIPPGTLLLYVLWSWTTKKAQILLSLRNSYL